MIRPAARDLLLRALRATLLVLLSAAAWSTPARSEPLTARAEAGPRVAVGEFYGWYLAALAANRDPLRDDPAGLSARVSATLIRELRKKLDSPDGMEADYFIQAQDYADDWLGHVALAPSKSNAATAVFGVVLGTQPATRQRLTVTLAREDGAWKIRRVAAR